MSTLQRWGLGLLVYIISLAAVQYILGEDASASARTIFTIIQLLALTGFVMPDFQRHQDKKGE